jgi:hypothetical protein
MIEFLWLLFSSSLWLVKALFLVGWYIARWATWLLWPLGAAIAGLGCRQANAGWFGWFAQDTSKLEAANRALHAAAEVANEAARLQADQNIRVAEAITAMSTERAQLVGHLQHLGELATQDSQWAAALSMFGPVLIATAVLAVGALALWLASRDQACDATLAEVLVESVVNQHGQLNLGTLNHDSPGPHLLLPEKFQADDSTQPTDEGMPF